MIASIWNLLAEVDAMQVLIIIVVLVFSALGAIFEKLKKSSENKTRQRPSVPPVIPPPTPEQREQPAHPPAVPSPRSAQPPTAPVRPRPSTAPRPAPMPTPRQRMEDVFGGAPAPAPRRQRAPRAQKPAAPQPQPARAPESAAEETTKSVFASVSTTGIDSAAHARAGTSPATPGFRRPAAAELRRAIVLNELLGPPLALRDFAGQP